MRTIKNFEKKPRGTPVFPCSIYHIDKSHQDYLMPFHWHTEYEIIVVRKGIIDFNINDTPVTACENDTVFVSEGILHGGTPRGDDCIYDCIVFGNEFLSKTSFSGSLGNIFYDGITANIHIKASEYPEISRSACELCDAFLSSSGNADEVICRGLMLVLFGKVMKSGCYSSSPPKINKHILHLKEVLRYIEEHYSEKITLDDLAAAAGVTPKYLCRSFSSLTGKTPIEYLNEYRIDCACEMLKTTDKPLVDIAVSCGFGDQSYFIRLFKRIKNITPRNYRFGTDEQK